MRLNQESNVKRIVILALAASLAACATVSTPSTAQIDRVQERYDQAKAVAALLSPYLPLDYVARIARAELLADQALLAARLASTIAEQRAALARAEAAIADVDTAVAPR
jgi:dipeptidase